MFVLSSSFGFPETIDRCRKLTDTNQQQPGSLITHWQILPSAGLTFLGAVSLTATVAAMFYTTASEAMVTPKLKYGGWERKLLEGRVRSSYANPIFVNEICLSPLRQFDAMDEWTAGGSCLDVDYSGQCTLH